MSKKLATRIRRRERPRYAQMSRRGLGTLHGLITDAWRSIHMYPTTCPQDFATAYLDAARNLNAALKIIEAKQGPLS